MVKLLVFALFLVFVMSIAVPVFADSSWWNVSYNFRKNLTINASYIYENSTNFPLLISITDTNLSASASTSGADIVFTDKTSTIKLAREIEFWNKSSGVLIAWVNVTLNSSLDDNIVMYYNSTTSVEVNNLAIWNPNYLAVYHMADNTTSTSNDSTLQHPLTKSASANPLEVTSLIYKGQSFTTDMMFDNSTADLLDVVSENGTIELWFTPAVNISTSHATMYMISKYNIGPPSYDSVNFGFALNTNNLAVDMRYGGGSGFHTLRSANRTWVAGTWYYISYSWGKAGMELYINGVLEASNNTWISKFANGTTTPFVIGKGFSNFAPIWYDYQCDGTYDEFRVYNYALTNGRINNSYQNYLNPQKFIIVGIEETNVTADTTLSNITFNSQVPADISVTNIFNQFLNISYNITDTSGINISTVKLYYKANSSDSDLFYCINGTSYFGFQTGGESFVNGSTDYNFSINDNEVYPASYNFNENAMRNTAHSAYDLSGNNKYIKIRLYNISDAKNYSFFEVFVQNQTSSSNALRVYYCNSSYSTGSPATNANCINFYNILASYPSNHTHGADSIHYVVPMPINKTSKMLGNVIVTPTSYFLLRGVAGINAWNVYYIANITRADTIQASANAGVAWSNFAGTVDAHIHQYDGTEAFHYYACANDTLGNGNCSDVRSDLIDLKGLPPSSPSVYAPAESIYAGNITINYTASASPNGYPISFYNISLVNLSEAFNLSIQSNNSLDLSYVWDSTAATDGEYYVKVVACDDQGQCSAGFSENFSIDNTPPILIISLPANATYNYDENLPLNYTVSDNIAVDKCWFNLDGGSNITIADCVNGTFDADKGSHILYMFANDTSGNLNNTEHVHFTVYSSSLAGCYELDRAGTIYFLTADIEDSDVTNCMDITANNVTLDCQGHLIDGVDSSSSYGIYINRGSATTTNITVKNCVLTDWRYGAYLYYANNNTVINSTSSSNYYGIYLISSSNNIIINSTSSDNSYGIYLESSSDNQIINSISDSNNYGIYLESSSNNTIINSTSNSNNDAGISLSSSFNNTMINLTANNNLVSGISLSSSNDNQIINLTSNSNGDYGINLESSSDNQITNSTSNSNGDYGIYISSSSYNIIINSTISSNSNYGIYLTSSPNNQIINSNSSDNSNGIYLESSSDNQIINSTSNSNSDIGIYLYSSNNNTIINSTSNSNNNEGISLSSSSDNQIINSISNSNEYGIVVDTSCSNQIINSIFNDNDNDGISLSSSSDNQIINSTSNNNSNAGISLASSSDNIIYNNLFNNTVNVGFAETSGDNNWNTTRQTGSRIYSNGTQIGGNYWTNSTGNGYSDTCTDAGKDGFCDANYTLSENNTDWLPLSDEYVLSYISIVLNFSSVGFGLLGENTTNNPAANIYQINVSTNCNAQVNFSALNPILASGSYNIPSSNMKFNYTVNTNDYPDLLSFDADRLVSVVGNDIVYPRYYLDIPANQHAGLYAGSQSITASCS
jgi:parallel beta-helix repeat protein